MFADGLQSERPPAATDTARRLAPVRVRGGVTLHFAGGAGATRLTDLGESGGYRAKFPDTHREAAEAVLVNTGGGIVGGDRVGFDVTLAGAGAVVVTSSAAERVYRSLGPDAEVDVTLTAAGRGRLAWLPQETCLYAGARLRRRFEADVAADAELLMSECVVIGRIASGEVVREGLLHDVWRVRRDGRLIFAEAVRLDGDIAALLARPAVADGARAVGMILLVSPRAEDRLAAVRERLAGARSLAGASAWNGLLCVRLIAPSAEALRTAVAGVVQVLLSLPVPRVWQIELRERA